MHDELYRIAREVTDEVMGPGAYAETNEGNSHPLVKEQVQISKGAAMTTDDPVLAGMADELHAGLVARGLDTKHPPSGEGPPSTAAFAEYQRRGGTLVKDPEQLATALVAAVVAKD